MQRVNKRCKLFPPERVHKSYDQILYRFCRTSQYHTVLLKESRTYRKSKLRALTRAHCKNQYRHGHGLRHIERRRCVQNLHAAAVAFFITRFTLLGSREATLDAAQHTRNDTSEGKTLSDNWSWFLKQILCRSFCARQADCGCCTAPRSEVESAPYTSRWSSCDRPPCSSCA